MNWKKALIATIVVFIVHEVVNFLVHGMILGSVYQTMMDTWRPDMNSMMWIMNIGNLIFAFFFVFIFAKGYEGKGIMEGVRYGLIMAGLITIPGMLAQFTVYNVTFTLTIYWIIFGFIQLVIDGIIVSLIYKPVEK